MVSFKPLMLLLFLIVSSTLGQPLPGGGGSDDGGGGGSDFGDSSSSSSIITCAPNCKYCTSDDTCDTCQEGYVLTSLQTCAACADNCVSCDNAGAGRCDACKRGFVLSWYSCYPCGPHCVNCDNAGRDSCDECEDGYMEERSRCLECTKNCRKCHDTSETGCDECFFWWKLQDGSCSSLSNTTVFLMFFLAVVTAACMSSVFFSRRFVSAGGQPTTHQARSLALTAVQSKEQYLQSAPLVTLDASLPSGMWRGYYTFSEVRHDVCEFSLNFEPAGGHVTGDGVDDVGRYNITGAYQGSRLAFSKTYIPRSANVSGAVSFGNQGHTVEYRGELAGTSLGAGFRGIWSIRSSLGNYDGQFHIWPAMAGWSDEAAHEAVPGATTFEESECVICYDRAISTCLRPCGHVALCSICASRLSPRKCPLCRVNITSIENRAPTDTESRPKTN